MARLSAAIHVKYLIVRSGRLLEGAGGRGEKEEKGGDEERRKDGMEMMHFKEASGG